MKKQKRRQYRKVGCLPETGVQKSVCFLPGVCKSPTTQDVQEIGSRALCVKTSLCDLQAVVVNLARRPDRYDGCVERMRAHCPWLPYRRLDATDGRRDPIDVSEVALAWHTGKNVVYQKIRSKRKGWDDLDNYVEKWLPLSPGERGCGLSHIHAWQLCLERGRPLLVFEDDAAPTADFTARLSRALIALPDDADLLYLGYSQAAAWRRVVSPDCAEAEYVWTTVGYIVWPAGARKLLSRLPIDQPVDNWMASLCAAGKVKSYCVSPKIVHQADSWNVNSDVAHSDEICSDICHSDAFYWGVSEAHGREPGSDIFHSDEFYWGPAREPGSDILHSDEFYWGTPDHMELPYASCVVDEL
jgi:GR25 family glycosyltransferase involved in LPS biosynthesis